MSKKQPYFSVEQKLVWMGRLLAGETVTDLAAELGMRSSNLYKWLGQYRRHGASGLSTAGHAVGHRSQSKNKEPPPEATDELSLAKRRYEESASPTLTSVRQSANTLIASNARVYGVESCSENRAH